MKLKLIQAPMADGQYNAPKLIDEQLLRSWQVVLTEYAPRERAGSQW
jgi:hypothetical protein